MRETIAIHYADDMSKDELDSLELEYETKGYRDVRIKVPARYGAQRLFTVTGIRPAPSKSIDFVNVTSRDPDNTELLEILADDGITGVKIDYFTEPYRFEDAFQIETLYYQ